MYSMHVSDKKKKRMFLAWYIENSVISVNGSFTNSAMHVEKYIRNTCNKDVSKNATYYLENRVILVIQFLLKKNILSFNHECSKVVSIILPNPFNFITY